MELNKTVKIVLMASVLVFAAWAPVPDAQGLGQRLAVQRIRAVAADLNLSIAQVDNLTQEQAYNHLITEYPLLPPEKVKELATYWTGIKSFLRQDAVQREMAVNQTMIRSGFGQMFPTVDIDWRYERTRNALSWLAYVATGEDPNDL